MRREQPTLSPRTSDEDALAIELGATWARSCAAELRGAGRPVAGGWPGTLKEAMTRVAAALGTRTTANGPSLDRLRELARAVYSSARTTWLAVSERDEEP